MDVNQILVFIKIYDVFSIKILFLFDCNKYFAIDCRKNIKINKLITNNNYAFTCIFFHKKRNRVNKLLIDIVENCAKCGRVLKYFFHLKFLTAAHDKKIILYQSPYVCLSVFLIHPL